MAIISQSFLEDIGISLDQQTYEAFAAHFEETLGDRIIDGIIDTLSDEELEQLTQLRADDDANLQTWLQSHVPDLKEIIEDELAILVGEIAENSEQINESTS